MTPGFWAQFDALISNAKAADLTSRESMNFWQMLVDLQDAQTLRNHGKT